MERKSFGILDYMKFLIPSIIGIFLLMIPFKKDGDTTIIVAYLAGLLTSKFSNILPTIILIMITISGIGSLGYKIFIKNREIEKLEISKIFKSFFDVSNIWIFVRLLGVVIVFMVYYKVGPEFIYSEDTGGLILYDLILGLFTIFLFAGFLLPFLTDFGLLEFIGVLLTPVMRPLFKLPGRSSINCVVSWVGDGTLGVAFTNNQYEEGYYTAREAAIISTNFSAVSITFCLLVLSQVGLSNMFGTYYLTTVVVGIIAAIIMARIPPLSRKPDTYYKDLNKDLGEDIPKGYTKISWGLELAVSKSRENFSICKFIKNGLSTVLDMWLGVLPVIMTFGTIALIIAEYTPIFKWLGLPFIPILKLLRIPYAVEASQTIMVGFADMFLPSVIGSSIPSDMTRFVIATLSVTQLVYLSEAGAVMLGSKIPINLWDMFIIFIERTLICLPIIALIAHMIF